MFKDTRTYIDFNGNERTEDFYFHLSTPELLEMQVTTNDGYDKYVSRIVSAENAKELIDTFKNILLKAYGEKSDDGRVFEKSEEISRRFSQTQAYSDIYMQLASDDVYAAKFMKGLIPSNFDKEVERLKNNAAEIAAKNNA